MTEEEWLTSADMESMLNCLVTVRFPKVEPCNWHEGERKKRLFVAGCLRRVAALLPAEYRALTELIELHADGLVDVTTRRKVVSAAERVEWDHNNLLFAINYDDIGLFCHHAASIATEAIPGGGDNTRNAESLKHAALLREIFGNPFRPVGFDPAWRTSDAMALATGIYDGRAFDRMPILADALQEAGCDNDDLLRHCRDPDANHVRGCWALDLVLGKE